MVERVRGRCQGERMVRERDAREMASRHQSPISVVTRHRWRSAAVSSGPKTRDAREGIRQRQMGEQSMKGMSLMSSTSSEATRLWNANGATVGAAIASAVVGAGGSRRTGWRARCGGATSARGPAGPQRTGCRRVLPRECMRSLSLALGVGRGPGEPAARNATTVPIRHGATARASKRPATQGTSRQTSPSVLSAASCGAVSKRQAPNQPRVSSALRVKGRVWWTAGGESEPWSATC